MPAKISGGNKGEASDRGYRAGVRFLSASPLPRSHGGCLRDVTNVRGPVISTSSGTSSSRPIS